MSAARIEICPGEDGYTVSMLDLRVHQRRGLERDHALRLAMQWCVSRWRYDVSVDIAEYDSTGRVRWQAQGLRSREDLQDLAECTRDASRFAEAATP